MQMRKTHRVLWLTQSGGNTTPVIPLNPYFVDYQSRIDTVYPEPYKTYFNDFFQDLDDAGQIQIMDYLRCFSNISRDASQTNMVDSNYKSTEVGAPAWVQYAGYTGGVGQYLTSGYNPNTDGVNYTQNSASIFGWMNASPADGEIMLGVTDATNYTYIQPNLFGDARGTINQDSLTPAIGGTVAGDGFFLLKRTDANTITLYRNGVQIATSNMKPSTAVVSDIISELCLGAGIQPVTTQVSFLGVGSGSLDPVALYNIFSTLRTNLGL